MRATAGVPERADGGDRFFKSRHRFRLFHAVGFVAFAFADTDAEDGATAGEQMQSRGGLCGDRRIAPTGIGHPHTEPQPPEPGSLRQMPSTVHGSSWASIFGTSLAAPK